MRVIAGTAALTAVAAVFVLGPGALLRHGAGAVTLVLTAIILPCLPAAAFPVLPAGAALTITVSAAVAAATPCPSGGCTDDPAKISLTGMYLGQAVAAVLAVMAVSGEYSAGMSRLTLAAAPRRVAVLAAKAAVLAGLVLVTGTVAVLGSLPAGGLILPGRGISPAHGYPAISPGDGPVLRAALGSVLYLVLIALLSLGAAAALREAAAATGAVLGLLYLFPIIAAVAGSPDLARHIRQMGPMTAGMEIQATTGLDSLPISPWAGLACSRPGPQVRCCPGDCCYAGGTRSQRLRQV